MANQYEKIALQTRKKVSKLTLEQQRQMLKLYDDTIDNLASKATSAKDKTLTKRWLLDYNKELSKAKQELAKEIKSKMENSIGKAAAIGTKTDQKIFNKIFNAAGIDTGDHFTSMFSQVQDNVVKDIISGNLYKDNRTLSQRIWNYSNNFEHDIQYVINQGILEKKSAIKLAKDLEKYVKDPAKRGSDWGKAYPNLKNKKVDANAQRLARTSINHSYQTSSIQSSGMNPFVEGVKWRSAQIHGRTCQLCIERATTDQYGLGIGVFPKDQVPLDHPNGLCTMLPHIPKTLDDVADELKAWLDGGDNPMLDDWYDEYGDYFSVIKDVVKSGNKGYNDNKAKEETINYIDRRKLTIEEVRQEMDAIYQSDYSKILNDKDEKNIYDYQIKTFTPYNDFLRGKRVSLEEPLMEGLELLKATTSKVTIKEDMILSRGTTISVLEGVKWEDLEAGEILTEKAFMSASAREKTAKKFAKKKKDRGVLIDIQVKKGNKAVFVDTAVDYNWESEFIFPPGTKLKVLEKWEDKGLKRIKGVIIDA